MSSTPISNSPARALTPDDRASRRFIAALKSVRSRARRLVVSRYLAGGLTIALLALLGAGLVDFALRLPMGVRLTLWLGGLAAAGWWCWRRLRPAIAFCPSLTEMALRIERSPTGEAAGLRGWLASALEFVQSDREDDGALGAHLRGQVRARAMEAFETIDPRETLDPAPTRRRGLHAAMAIAAIALVVGLTPSLASIGAVRTLVPWAGAKWPSRTAITDVTAIEVHPMDVATPIRALLTRTHLDEGETDVAVRYRVVADGDTGPWRRALLTSQGSSQHMIGVGAQAGTEVETAANDGELFERLIEPMGLGETGAAEARLEYTLETLDDRTPAASLLLVRPPAVRSARLRVTPPAYAEPYAERENSEIVSGASDLGAGDDERAIAGPILARSR
ncbi:MAG: hypothetical protein AAGK04_03025, partial [Planctomycetota bacterium]